MEAIVPLFRCYPKTIGRHNRLQISDDYFFMQAKRRVFTYVKASRCDGDRRGSCRHELCPAACQAGHRTILLDRQSFPRHKTCGEFMSPETREMLEYLGVHLQVQELNPAAMDHCSIVMPHGGAITAPLPGKATGISRYELDRLLHENAVSAGAEIVTGLP